MAHPHRSVGLAIAVVLALVPSSQAASWKAGVAKVEITPAGPMWMSGYAAREKPAEGTLISLWAKALVLEDPAGKRAALVTLDLVGIDRGISERVCKRIGETHRIPRECVALNCSHTHTGPVVGDNLRPMYSFDEKQVALVRAYTKSLEDKIVAVVGEAAKNLAPAALSWGHGRATLAVNRRNNKEADVPALRTAGRLKGPVDYDVPVLAVRDEKGNLRAVVFGYACHATVLNSFEWSGDWPGFAQLEWEKAHPEATVLFMAGCGADQNPLPRREVALAQKYGKQMALAIDEAIAGVMRPIEGRLACAYSQIDLKYAKLPTRDELLTAAASKNKYEVNRAKLLLETWERERGLKDSYPYPVQAWQLGNGPTLAILGGEVVVDYALRLKAELGADTTWVAGYSNDVMAYIPSRRVLLEGGYEGGESMVYYGLPSRWADDVETRVVNEAYRLVKKAKAELAAAPTYRDHSRLLVYVDETGSERPVESARDWAVRRKHILAGMQAALGEMPDRSKLLPLDVRETRRELGDGYTRVWLSLAGDEGDRVPAHLYLPDRRAKDERRPAMLALHQTSPDGKNNVADVKKFPNLAYAVELAQRGYIVLAPDYPSFGDYKYDFKTGRYPSGTLKGIVNHMRCVDLLASRSEVDPERIGVIGHSLGGHNAMFLAAFDERLKAVVSSCGWTPFSDYYGGKIAGWTSDRYMPRLRDVYDLDADRVPFDFYEVVAGIAPRAFFSNSPLGDDNFAVGGVRKAIVANQEVFRLLGAETRLAVRYPECGHDFPPDVRREAYGFVDRVLRHEPTSR